MSSVRAFTLSLVNGNMESPASGSWSTTRPSNWTWSGTGTVGLTSTGGAESSTQTLYGNQIAGTLTSDILSDTVPGAGTLTLSYWTKRESSGSLSVTARISVGGNVAASRVDSISTSTWTKYTVTYNTSASDVGKSLQVQFVFSNGSGSWQGYLDEVSLDFSPSVSFSAASATLQDTDGSATVTVTLSSASTNPVTLDYSVVGGTATLGTDFNFTPGTLTIAPGSTSASFTFSINKLPGYQGKKTIVFLISNPSNAAVGSIQTFTATIVDPEDKPAPVTYYLDSNNGNDSNSGTSPDAPWQTLGKANSVQYNPGDTLLLKTGSSWTGQLAPQGSGDSTAQITVDMYGSGAKPIINAGGINGGAVSLSNQEYWSINNLELTNIGDTSTPKKQGILIVNDCVGTLSGISIRNCNIHDVDGVMTNYADGKESGGIVFKVTASNLYIPSKWEDITIEDNTITNVTREGILLESMWVNKPQDQNTYWSGLGNYYPSTNLRIAGNTLQVIGGDGIIPWAVDGGMVEHNYVSDCNTNTPGQGHAAVWPYICANITFQYNEVCRTRTTYDGMAFDFDNSNQDCIYQYNYSHDNEGGFLNLCSAGNSNRNIARYNVSQNDGCASGSRVFLIDSNGNNNDLVYNNTIYVNTSNPELFHQGATSTGSTIYFSNNIFFNAGSGSVSSPGGCYFDNNLFYGTGSISADANKLVADPKLAGAGSGGSGLSSVVGYKLLIASPALNAGKIISNNGGIDYWGNVVSSTAKPNIGAYDGAGISGWQWNPAGGNSASDGAGVWDNSTLNWWDGNSATNWPGLAMAATFGAGAGAAGQVTIPNSQVVGGLTFNAPGSGQYTIAGGSLTLSTSSIVANANASITSILLGNGLTKSGTGTLTLGGVNTYIGATTVNAGTLAITNGGKIYSPGWSSSVTTVNSGATLLLDNWSQGLMSDYAASNLVINGGTVTYAGSETNSPTSINGSYGRAFTIGSQGGTLKSEAPSGYVWAITRYNSGSTYSLTALGGTLTLSGSGNGYISKSLFGSNGLVKSGGGTWTLAGANTYTGVTSIDAGTLKLDSSATISGTPKITVASGATFDASIAGFTVGTGQTLSGSGTITGLITLASGAATIDLQDGSPSTLILNGGLKLNSGNVLNFDISSSSDQIALSGPYTAPSTGTVTVNINGLSSLTRGTYPLIIGASGISASSFTLGSKPSGHLYALIASGGTLSLVVDGIEAYRLAAYGTTDNGGNAADTACPSGDGIPNLLKYATGMDLATPGANTPVTQGVIRTDTGSFLTLTFNRVADPSLTYVVEACSDPSANTWTSIWTSSGNANTAGLVTVQDTIPQAEQPKRFLRLRVTR